MAVQTGEGGINTRGSMQSSHDIQGFLALDFQKVMASSHSHHFFLDPPLWATTTTDIMAPSHASPSAPKTPRRKMYKCHCESTAARKLRHLNPLNCNAQSKSPLFTRIPGEIRNMIFSLVLEPQDRTPIDNGTYHYRPDYSCNRVIDTTLLRVCRRIYLETRALVATRDSVLRIWIGSVARAPTTRKHLLRRTSK